MKFKVITGLVWTLFLIGMLTLALNIQPVRASGTIYIRPDGSIEGTDKIQRNGDVYTFTDNIYDEIVLEKNNIVVDGAGYTLQGNGSGDGIVLSWRSYVTIRNINIKGFQCGIFIATALSNCISGNNITNNGIGIMMIECSDNSISGNSMTNNIFGFRLFGSSNNTISGNNVVNNDWGIDGIFSDSTISGNNITNNSQYGVYLLKSSANTFFANNLSNNNDGLMLHRSYNNTISENSINNNNGGIRFYNFSDYNIVSGNNITNNEYGIRLTKFSSGNKFYHNNFINNTNQVYSSDSVNVWDNGYPSGGNYWSDHACTGNPSNGSQPYIINENNTDHYPFQDPNGWLLPKPPVGGNIVPVNKLELLTPYIGIISVILATITVVVKKRKLVH